MNFHCSKLKEYDIRLFISTLDTIYYTIIVVTARCIRAYTNAQEHARAYEIVATTEIVEDESLEQRGISTFKAINEILKVDTVAPTYEQTKNTVMYAGKMSVPVYANPTIEFDTLVDTIPYGEMVMMIEPRGRFFRVIRNGVEGWVFRDDLVDRAIRVYPEFISGEENSVNHSNTVHVRAILGDIFGLQRSDFPLQAGEYALYRLWKKGIHIEWPQERPRTPGLWHKILKGSAHVHIGVSPKASSIMEYVSTDDVGHLAYVEDVFPDDTISISEANYPDSGIYNERELLKSEWKELKPVFIQVSSA